MVNWCTRTCGDQSLKAMYRLGSMLTSLVRLTPLARLPLGQHQSGVWSGVWSGGLVKHSVDNFGLVAPGNHRALAVYSGPCSRLLQTWTRTRVDQTRPDQTRHGNGNGNGLPTKCSVLVVTSGPFPGIVSIFQLFAPAAKPH